MAGSNEKGSFSADISQEVIDAALRSVERRADPGEVAVTLEVEADEPPAEAAELPIDEAAEVSDALAEARKELEMLRAQLEFSQAEGRKLMERMRESHERAVRAVADLENYKKRAQKEKEEVQKFGAERLLKDLLPVMDNLDRAIDAAAKSPDIDSFQKGVVMTRKSFEDALARHGVKSFSAKGQPFDPHRHEAMQQVETTEVPPGHVAMEVVRGFLLNERLVRPALVIVARAPAPPPEPPAPAAEPPVPAAEPPTAAAEPATPAAEPPAPAVTAAAASDLIPEASASAAISSEPENTPGGSP